MPCCIDLRTAGSGMGFDMKAIMYDGTRNLSGYEEKAERMIKRRWRTGLLCLLLIALLLSAGAYAEQAEGGTLKLPESLEVVEQEAFMNAASVRSVILPEGAKEIHARAFAGSSVRTMNLPEAIGYIAEDAFAGCEKLTVSVPRDSYAHHFASDHNMKYTIVEPEGGELDENAGYAIYNVECVTEIIENLPRPHRYFKVDADMAERCDIEVRFYDEEDPDGEPVQYYCEELDASEMSGDEFLVILPYEAYFPEYFILDVRLIRSRDGAQMGETYITYDYTKRHAEIMNKTQADYADREIISYGDAGYAVLEDGVIRAAGAKTAGGYVLTPPRALEKGDVLYLDLGDTNKAVKVKSVIDNGDGSVTVMPDEDICLSDVFVRLDISGYMQPSEGVGASAVVTKGGVTVIPVSPEFKLGPVTVEGSAGIAVKLDVRHDKEADYFAVECWVETTADLEIKLTEGINTRDWDDNPFEIPLGPSIDIEISGTDIGGELGVTIPLNFELDVGGSIFVNVKNKVGFSCNSDNKRLNRIDQDESEAYAEVVGKVSADVGPQLKLKLDLMEMLDTGIRGQIGVKAEGELEGLNYGGSVSNPEGTPPLKHACLGCLNCDISIFAGIWAKLEGRISDTIDFDLFDEPIISMDPIKIGDAYWSFLNEKESVYGGEPSFGFTECINNKYYTHFTTYDYRGDEVSGVPLSIPAGSVTLTGSSPAGFYLYPGKYGVTAGFASGDYTKEFSVTQYSASYPLEEPDVKIIVTVIDGDTENPVSGAVVEYTLPDGSQVSGVTDEAGQTRFEHLPGGEYSLTVSAEGYLSETIDRLTYTPGMNVSVEVALIADAFPVLTANVDAYAGGSHFKDQALTEEGTCPDGVPEIWLSKSSYSKVQVTNENWSKAFSYQFSNASGQTDLLAIHMGNNEYTYVLIGYSISQMGGQEIVVFHEKDGAFGILAEFDGSDSRYDHNVTTDATFTSKADFRGVIYPTEYRFEGYRTADDLDYYDRVGVQFWRTNNLGYMSYGKNDQGSYDLIFKMPEFCYGIVGYTATRYRMSGGVLQIAGQWFEPVYGTLTFP